VGLYSERLLGLLENARVGDPPALGAGLLWRISGGKISETDWATIEINGAQHP
jgi:hypothetical protein